jgi:hypothetical protein
MGVRPLWRSYAHPFEAYPLEALLGELSADPPRFSFVVLGNTDLTPEKASQEEEPALFDAIMADIRSIHPPPVFLFHLGDIAGQPGDKEAWEMFIQGSKPFEFGFFPGSLLDRDKRRCFVVPGEKDVYDKPTESAFLEHFFRPSGNIPYSFDWQEYHFIALNSERTDEGWLMDTFGFNRQKNRIAGDQLLWLERDLERNRQKEIVVFMHKPLFPPVFSRHDGDCMDRYYWDRENLLDLLSEYAVKVIFMGHEPIFHWTRIQETHHVVTGGAGRKIRAARRLGGFHHFLYVTIGEASRMDVFCVDPERDTVEDQIELM